MKMNEKNKNNLFYMSDFVKNKLEEHGYETRSRINVKD